MMSYGAPFRILVPLALALLFIGSTEAQLEYGFYRNSCPAAEFIVFGEMMKIVANAPFLTGPFLRMHYHDCFVHGCDGSLLLNSTNNIPAEKDAPPNLPLRGFDVIDGIKAKLEMACPGIVSCADILAMIARDSVHLTYGPHYPIETGRRDGSRSVANDTRGNLQPPTSNFSVLVTTFIQKGLTAKDLVVLTGAHTIGHSLCSSFSTRLYNFTGHGDVDPALDPTYVPTLESECKPTDNTTRVEMDPGSSSNFDLGYYRGVARRRGLFTSDDTLLSEPETKAYIERQIMTGSPDQFFKDFAESMVKMGRIQVLTGDQGQIRKKCAFVNY